jgi:hypothetical protein
MAVAILEKNNLILSIPKNMLSDKLIQKVIRLIEFNQLTQDNKVAEQEAFIMAEELKTNWWEANKAWFLKDVQQ